MGGDSLRSGSHAIPPEVDDPQHQPASGPDESTTQPDNLHNNDGSTRSEGKSGRRVLTEPPMRAPAKGSIATADNSSNQNGNHGDHRREHVQATADSSSNGVSTNQRNFARDNDRKPAAPTSAESENHTDVYFGRSHGGYGPVVIFNSGTISGDLLDRLLPLPANRKRKSDAQRSDATDHPGKTSKKTTCINGQLTTLCESLSAAEGSKKQNEAEVDKRPTVAEIDGKEKELTDTLANYEGVNEAEDLALAFIAKHSQKPAAPEVIKKLRELIGPEQTGTTKQNEPKVIIPEIDGLSNSTYFFGFDRPVRGLIGNWEYASQGGVGSDEFYGQQLAGKKGFEEIVEPTAEDIYRYRQQLHPKQKDVSGKIRILWHPICVEVPGKTASPDDDDEWFDANMGGESDVSGDDHGADDAEGDPEHSEDSEGAVDKGESRHRTPRASITAMIPESTGADDPEADAHLLQPIRDGEPTSNKMTVNSKAPPSTKRRKSAFSRAGTHEYQDAAANPAKTMGNLDRNPELNPESILPPGTRRNTGTMETTSGAASAGVKKGSRALRSSQTSAKNPTRRSITEIARARGWSYGSTPKFPNLVEDEDEDEDVDFHKEGSRGSVGTNDPKSRMKAKGEADHDSVSEGKEKTTTLKKKKIPTATRPSERIQREINSTDSETSDEDEVPQEPITSPRVRSEYFRPSKRPAPPTNRTTRQSSRASRAGHGNRGPSLIEISDDGTSDVDSDESEAEDEEEGRGAGGEYWPPAKGNDEDTGDEIVVGAGNAAGKGKKK